jgi:hypothetical protein
LSAFTPGRQAENRHHPAHGDPRNGRGSICLRFVATTATETAIPAAITDRPIDPIPTNWSVRLALTAIALVMMLAVFLMICIQAGRDGMHSTLRYWQATLFSSPYHGGGTREALPQPQASVAPSPQTGASRASTPARTRAADGVAPSGSEPARVAAALRASLRDYKSDSKRTTTVTLTTGGSIQQKTAGSSTTLDGIPIPPAVADRPR